MKVILLKDFRKYHKWQVLDFESGFIFNFLIPRGIAKIPSSKDLLKIKEKNKNLALEKEKEEKNKIAIIKTLKDQKNIIKAKKISSLEISNFFKTKYQISINPTEIKVEKNKDGFKASFKKINQSLIFNLNNGN